MNAALPSTPRHTCDPRRRPPRRHCASQPHTEGCGGGQGGCQGCLPPALASLSPIPKLFRVPRVGTPVNHAMALPCLWPPRTLPACHALHARGRGARRQGGGTRGPAAVCLSASLEEDPSINFLPFRPANPAHPALKEERGLHRQRRPSRSPDAVRRGAVRRGFRPALAVRCAGP